MERFFLKDNAAVNMRNQQGSGMDVFGKLIKMQTEKKARKLDNWLEEHDRANPFPKDVRLTENVDYFGDGKATHRMDIYYPCEYTEEPTEKLPVLINIHGGGFLLGKKEANRLFCADMSKWGFVVFCLEYPLAPESNVFEIFRDLTVGINRVAEIADDYGADPSQLYLCGDSAGAYLCTYLSAIQNEPEIAKAADCQPIKPKIMGLGLQSGMFYTGIRDKIGIFLPKLICGKGWRRKPFYPYINPEHPNLIRSLPPCFLLTSKGDYLYHYTQKFAAALEKNGIKHRLLCRTSEKELPHAFATMMPETFDAEQANMEMTLFFFHECGK